MMARNASVPFTGRIQKRKTYHLQSSFLACNARPVHTVGSKPVRLKDEHKISSLPLKADIDW
jgi:hypothetical protein